MRSWRPWDVGSIRCFVGACLIRRIYLSFTLSITFDQGTALRPETSTFCHTTSGSFFFLLKQRLVIHSSAGPNQVGNDWQMLVSPCCSALLVWSKVALEHLLPIILSGVFMNFTAKSWKGKARILPLPDSWSLGLKLYVMLVKTIVVFMLQGLCWIQI